MATKTRTIGNVTRFISDNIGIAEYSSVVRKDPDGDGEYELAVINEYGECETSFFKFAKRQDVEQALKYLRESCRLNNWQLAQLFNYDGHSSGLTIHIISITADLPPRRARNFR